MLRKLSVLLIINSALTSDDSSVELNSAATLLQVTEPVNHGEGPCWDNRTGRLYYVDMHSGSLHSFDFEGDKDYNISLPGDLTVAVPSKHDPNVIIVGWNRSIAVLHWDGKNLLKNSTVLTYVSDDQPRTRFNDGKADREGRLWFGTMGSEDDNGNLDPNSNGTLYFVTRSNVEKPLPVLTPVKISNGLAWNKANDKFYYIDTPTDQVKEFDYDNESGAISNPRVVFDLTEHEKFTGHPDGMTIDEDDNLWIALYGGGVVLQVDPREKIPLQYIALPALYVTSVAWGGPNLDILFITTSRRLLNEDDRRRQPTAGSVFAAGNLQTKGLPAFMADIENSRFTKRKQVLFEMYMRLKMSGKKNRLRQKNTINNHVWGCEGGRLFHLFKFHYAQSHQLALISVILEKPHQTMEGQRAQKLPVLPKSKSSTLAESWHAVSTKRVFEQMLLKQEDYAPYF